MNSRRIALPLLLGAALLGGAAPARAQGAADQKSDPAWVYFNAGQQAYAAGKYAYAIQAFQDAYRLSSKPGLVFSIAQAYRKQYTAQKSPKDLRKAVENYRKYIEVAPDGPRKPDALSALEDLEPLLAKLAEQEPEAATPAPEAPAATSLVVTVSVPTAMISVDGGKPGKAPFTGDVKPGTRKVQITAEGYYPETREVPVSEGRINPLDIQLREMPGQIQINAMNGALVTVDGRPMGTTPLSRPIEVPAGVRTVAVTHNGFKPFVQDVRLKRGEKRQLTVDLETTKQRVISYIAFGAGAVSAGFGLVAALGAGAAQVEAQSINDKREKGQIDTDQLGRYQDLVSQRDQLRGAAAASFGAAAVLGGTGFLLFLFDTPSVIAPPPRSEPSPTPAAPPPQSRALDIAAAPAWAPGFIGGTARGHF